LFSAIEECCSAGGGKAGGERAKSRPGAKVAPPPPAPPNMIRTFGMAGGADPVEESQKKRDGCGNRGKGTGLAGISAVAGYSLDTEMGSTGRGAN